MRVGLNIAGHTYNRVGQGSGPIEALQSILAKEGVDVRVLDYSEHTLAAVGSRVLWGVGIDSSTTRASLKAMISAVNRALRDSAE